MKRFIQLLNNLHQTVHICYTRFSVVEYSRLSVVEYSRLSVVEHTRLSVVEHSYRSSNKQTGPTEGIFLLMWPTQDFRDIGSDMAIQVPPALISTLFLSPSNIFNA